MISDLKYYAAFFEVLAFSIFMIFFDFFILAGKSFNLPFFQNIDSFPLYGLNYISIYLLLMLFRCLKIHKTAKKRIYQHMLSVLKRKKHIHNGELKSDAENIGAICQEEENFYKYLVYYVWMRNKNSQAGLTIFTVGGILLGVVIFGNGPDFFIFLVCILFFWGLVKLAQGITEVV